MDFDLVLRAATSTVKARHNKLLFQIESRSESELLSLLAQATIGIASGQADDAVLAAIVDPDQNLRGPGLAALGKRILQRWSLTLYQFVCSPYTDDKDLQERLRRTLTGKAGGTAALTAVLIAAFGLAPVTAGLLATLLVRLIVAPAADELCIVWGETLRTPNGGPVSNKELLISTMDAAVKKSAATAKRRKKG